MGMFLTYTRTRIAKIGMPQDLYVLAPCWDNPPAGWNRYGVTKSRRDADVANAR
jgi:hypothetical protein